MSDKLRMIFVLGRVRMCPKTQIEVLSSVKMSDKQHPDLFYCSIILFLYLLQKV